MIKEGIGKIEFKRLVAYVKADDTLRESSKENLLKTFTLLYYLGCRISELLTITNKDITDLLKNNELVIYTSKTNSERKLIITPQANKEISKLMKSFNYHKEPLEAYLIKSKGNLYKAPKRVSFTTIVNRVIKECLGNRYSSHSFRIGVITELGLAQINPKVIQSFIGHKNISTTLNYIRVGTDDIRDVLIR